MKRKVLFATNNPGKLTEAITYAKQAGVELLSPQDCKLQLEVPETGTTFTENAALKATAFAAKLNDPNIVVIADDSGIQIPALNNEPGVYSRRWSGYEMTDQEIVDYCLERMKDLHGKQRRAHFVAVLAVKPPGHDEIHYFRGEMEGEIKEKPVSAKLIEGFPFRQLMYLPQIDKMIYEIHGTTIAERDGFMTHREQALQKAFDYISDL